ncbi:hypothetical protein LNQ03_15540 [Klebsiella pneumoniae subsp. pneumoniae]|nr:hypothetical protein [Klebsiella pneumoniae subsp. pneumoniae]
MMRSLASLSRVDQTRIRTGQSGRRKTGSADLRHHGHPAGKAQYLYR